MIIIAPRQNQRFSSRNVSWPVDSRNDALSKIFLHIYIVLFAKEGLSNDDVGVARVTVSQEIRKGAGFKTDRRFRSRKVGGATVERLKIKSTLQTHICEIGGFSRKLFVASCVRDTPIARVTGGGVYVLVKDIGRRLPSVPATTVICVQRKFLSSSSTRGAQ